MLLIEIGLMLFAVILAFACPESVLLSRGLERWFARLAQRRRLAVLAVGITTVALRTALLPILPIPYPGVNDEFSYILMADTFAHGRLTNMTHPMWVHFESITVIHQPTYCSVFYPAQGMFLALGQIVAGHPFWGVCLSAGLMCAAITWMLQGWVPPFWALVGGLLATIRLGTFSYWANSYFGGAVAAIGGALVLGALPRLRSFPGIRNALLLGVGLALVANSRPYEGLFFSLPVIAALIWTLRKKGWGRSFRSLILPLGLVLAATACFMLYYFWRTTGNPLRPPYFVNLQTYFVDPGFPWLPLRPIPHYQNEMIRNYYLGWNLSQFRYAQAHPILAIVVKVLMLWFFFLGPLLSFPFLMLAIVLPSRTSLKDLGRRVRFLLLVCCLTLIAVLLPSYDNPHYAAPITAAIYALVLIAMQRVRRWRVGVKRAGITAVRMMMAAAVLLFLLRVAIPVFHLRILNSSIPETWASPWNQFTARAQIEAALDKLPGRQLILVRYGPQDEAKVAADLPMTGWVNNSADIDGSPIVWAHSMGPILDGELISYYKDRKVWILEAAENPARLYPYAAASTK